MTISFGTIAEKIFAILSSANYKVDMFDYGGKKVYDKSQARKFFTHPAGNMVIIHQDGDEKSKIKVSLSKDVDIKEFEKVAGHRLRMLATQQGQNMSYDIRKHGKPLTAKDFDHQTEGNYEMNNVIESAVNMTGTTRSSYQRVGECRIIIRHQDRVNENKFGSRSRNIQAIFVETKGGERFKVAENNLHGARAMARHLSNGGSPFDTVGMKVSSMMEEMSKLKSLIKEVKNFNRLGQLNEESSSLLTNIREHYIEIRETLKKMSGKIGYGIYTPQLEGVDKNDINETKNIDGEMETDTKSAKDEDPKVDQVPIYDRPEGLDNLVRRDAPETMHSLNNESKLPEDLVLETWFDKMSKVQFFREEDLHIDDSSPKIKKILPENAHSTLNLYMNHPSFNYYLKMYEEQGILDEVISLIEEDSKLWTKVLETRKTLNEYPAGNYEANPPTGNMHRVYPAANQEETTMDNAMEKLATMISDRKMSLDVAIEKLAQEMADKYHDGDEDEKLRIVEDLYSRAEEFGLTSNDPGSTFADDILAPNEEIKKDKTEIEAEEYYGSARFNEDYDTDWEDEDDTVVVMHENKDPQFSDELTRLIELSRYKS